MRLSTENLLKPLMSHRLFYMQIHLTKAHTLGPASACLCVLFDALEQPQNARFMSVRVKFYLHACPPSAPQGGHEEHNVQGEHIYSSSLLFTRPVQFTDNNNKQSFVSLVC